jgi:ClpP class serine protease
MSRESVDSIAQGRVWAGKDALGIGLADETGILMDAVRYAASKAGITKYRIVAYPAKKSFLEDLRSRKASDKSDPIVRVREVLPPGFTMVARLPYIRIEGTGTRKQ